MPQIRHTEEREHPVIIKMLDHQDEVAVLHTCSKLKGTKLSITEDFSTRVCDTRKKLCQSSVQECMNGSKVKLLSDKLSIDGSMFGWDSEKNKQYKITNKRKDQGN